MRKGLVAGAVALVVLAGAGVAGLPLAERYFADSIKAEIDRDGIYSVGAVDVGLLDRRISMRDMRSRELNGLSAARWQVTGLSWPLAEILKGHTPLQGYRLGDPLTAERLEVDDLRLDNALGQSWRFGSIVAEGVDLEAFDPMIPPGPFQPVILGARVVQALSLRHMEERDASYLDPATHDTIGFKSLTADALEHGRIGSVALSGFEAAGKAATEPSFGMASLKGDGLDLRPILKAMSQASFRAGQPVGHVGIDKATATGFGGELLARYGLSLGSISVEVRHDSPGVARSTTRVDGFVMVPPMKGVEGVQARMAMLAMGLKELQLGLECSGTENRGKGEVEIDRCALNGADLGELNFTARLVGADAAFWRAIDGGNIMSIYSSAAALADATLSLADRGLLDRGFRALAGASGQAPAATRANMAAEIRRYQPPNVLITDDLTKLLETVAGFVEKGGTLTLEARPDPPLGIVRIGTMRQPGPDLVNLLGLTAKVSK
jgi:hypothetical protein